VERLEGHDRGGSVRDMGGSCGGGSDVLVSVSYDKTVRIWLWE